jgi:acylpyruvate hydrolase
VKLAVFRAPGQAEPFGGSVAEGAVTAFGPAESVVEILAGAPVPSAQASWPLSEVELLAPIQSVGTIYAVGLNYPLHIEESGVNRPASPVVFVKPRGSAAPPTGPVRRPAVVTELDYEGELAIVMGAEGSIGGYCVANDVTARDLQSRERFWTRAKGADTFCPFGPWVTTAEEIPNPDDLQLRTWVNGALRQNSSTSKQIFSCAELVAYISETCSLLPGDLILTGTPEGVGRGLLPPQFLVPGDTVRIEIEKLGAIEHAVE